jgi:predicted enzyme related to lactoylglutathione lyase
MWADLTVDDAIAVRDFYCQVAGWTYEGVSMGDYEDFMMKNQNGDVVAGICFRKGSNEKIPPYWINYITVESVEASVAQVKAHGGELLDGPRKMGEDHYALIKDPAGAVFALYGKL